MPVIQIKKGDLLIAKPNLCNDDMFEKSIVLLADHSVKGSVGFILNKSLSYNLNDLLPNINCNFPVYNGGPVEQESLYFVHSIPNLITNSVKIGNGLYWGGDFSEVITLLNNNKIKKTQIKFFLGYTGWGVNQLNDEIEENAWFIDANLKNQNLLNINNITIWKKKILEHNPDFAIWINAPIDPSNN